VDTIVFVLQKENADEWKLSDMYLMCVRVSSSKMCSRSRPVTQQSERQDEKWFEVFTVTKGTLFGDKFSAIIYVKDKMEKSVLHMLVKRAGLRCHEK